MASSHKISETPTWAVSKQIYWCTPTGQSGSVGPSTLQSSSCHCWGCPCLSPTSQSLSALLSKICRSDPSSGLPFALFLPQSLPQASWELRTGAPRKRVREKPVTQAPAEFVFHVLICNHFVFYEGYFLKLCQHDGNICGAFIHDVTLLVERWDENLLFSDISAAYGPVRWKISGVWGTWSSPSRADSVHSFRNSPHNSACTDSRWFFLPIIYLNFFSSFLNFVLLWWAQLCGLWVTQIVLFGIFCELQVCSCAGFKDRAKLGEQTLPLEIVIAGFRANDAKVKGPLLI